MDVQQALFQFEQTIFRFINQDCASSVLDGPMMILRQATTWIPIYLFFLIFFISNFRYKAIAIILLTLLCFAITDITSAKLLKPLIARVRPCHVSGLGFTLNNITGCGGMYSFPSSHASNHFGLATFWFLVIQQLTFRRWYWLFFWAASVCFAQVYVGVHYPGDIAGGALLGILTGYLCFLIFRIAAKRKAEPQSALPL